jgi:hypothetical protein
MSDNPYEAPQASLLNVKLSIVRRYRYRKLSEYSLNEKTVLICCLIQLILFIACCYGWYFDATLVTLCKQISVMMWVTCFINTYPNRQKNPPAVDAVNPLE